MSKFTEHAAILRASVKYYQLESTKYPNIFRTPEQYAEMLLACFGFPSVNFPAIARIIFTHYGWQRLSRIISFE